MPISVCIATFNGANYIREQIQSILPQLGEDDEMIVSDDGSTDDTIAIIESFHDQRIRLYRNEGRHGFVWNFENALMKSIGDVVFLCDQDDVWKPNKVRVVSERLQQYDLVVHDAEMIDGKGDSLEKNYYSTTHQKKGFFPNLWKTRWLGCCMAFRREVLEKCLPFPQNVAAHDYWIGMLGMLKFRYCFMDDILICYRRHGDNTTPSGEKSNSSFFYKLVTKRCNLMMSLLGRIIRIYIEEKKSLFFHIGKRMAIL